MRIGDMVSGLPKFHFFYHVSMSYVAGKHS